MTIYVLPILSAVIAGLLSTVPIVAFDEIVSVLAALVSLGGSILILFLPDVVGNAAQAITPMVYVDGLTKIMVLTIAAVYLGAVLFSISYLKYIKNPLFQKKIYYFLINIFVATMFFSVTVANMGLIWIGVEATTVTSALLVALENDEVAIEASWRYVIIVSIGLVISFIASVMLYAAGRTFSLAELLQHGVGGHLALLSAALAIVGFGTKAGLFPVFTWLPDVHGKAPSPVSALFSAVLLPVAVYAIARFLDVAGSEKTGVFLLVLAVLTVGSAALLLTVQTDLKRMFAYSTIENMGIILIGVAIGGRALAGAVILLVAHAFGKSASFYLSGNILSRFGTVTVSQIRGVGRSMPFTGMGLFFAALAVTGAPPFGAFIGEFLILSALYAQYGLALTVTVGLLIAISFIAVNARVASVVFSPGRSRVRERGFLGVWVPVVSTALSLATVFFVPAIIRLLSGVIGS